MRWRGDGRTLEADAVVAGLGIEPNVELAAEAGLPVANGIVVDDFRAGSAGREDVFAAGDVARFPVAALGGDRRVEHEDHAKSHGGWSARTWPAPTSPTTTCRSSTPTSSISATRLSASSTRAHGRSSSWASSATKGLVYYLDGEGRPRGVLLWNLFGRVDEARELIRAGEPIQQGALGSASDHGCRDPPDAAAPTRGPP